MNVEEFTHENKKGEEIWTKEGQQFGARLVNSIIEIDKALKASNTITPVPEWANSSDYDLPKEAKLKIELLNISEQIDAMQQQKQQLQSRLADEGLMRRLLFEKGHPLEDAILQALNIMGFSASQYKDNMSEFDVVFESLEGRFLGEAEGKDNGAVGIEKLRQLEMNIHEDLEREEVLEPAKSVLFGNAYRLLPLAERADFFTQKCLTAAQRSKTALVRTPDLFRVAQYLSEETDEVYAAECRKAILESNGKIVQFPEQPSSVTEKIAIEAVEEKEKQS